MSVLPLFILATTALFLVTLVVQHMFHLKFCAICVTVSMTWLSLLLARLFGYGFPLVLIGVLMGESIIGLYQFVEKRAPASWQIFRWPYIITMTVGAYLMLGARFGGLFAISLLALIWIVWGSMFVLRQYPLVKKIAERLITCCRDW